MRRIGLMLVGIAALTIASWVEVPMVPVPMTLQSLAVLLVGAYGGSRWGTATVLGWLALALLGAPVLAGMEGGWAKFTGPTAGYLFGFPLAAMLMGAAGERGWLDSTATALGITVMAHVVIVGLGFLRLQAVIGPSDAWNAGVGPFVLGMAIKSAVAVGLRPRR